MYVDCCGGSNVHVPSEPGGMVSHRIYRRCGGILNVVIQYHTVILECFKIKE